MTVVSTHLERASTAEAGRQFPSDFLWGAATSSYQIEGATGAATGWLRGGGPNPTFYSSGVYRLRLVY